MDYVEYIEIASFAFAVGFTIIICFAPLWKRLSIGFVGFPSEFFDVFSVVSFEMCKAKVRM